MQEWRKIAPWVFAATSLMYLLIPNVSILYPSTRHHASTPRNLLSLAFFAIVPIICGMAWWSIWQRKPSARGWGIGASVVHILIYLRPIILFSPSLWWHHMGALAIGIGGLVIFSQPDRQHGSYEAPHEPPIQAMRN